MYYNINKFSEYINNEENVKQYIFDERNQVAIKQIRLL